MADATFALIIEVIVSQLMADNFSASPAQKFIDFRIEIQMTVFGKEASTSRPKTLVPKAWYEIPSRNLQAKPA